jgi:hypothetical protein
LGEDVKKTDREKGVKRNCQKKKIGGPVDIFEDFEVIEVEQEKNDEGKKKDRQKKREMRLKFGERNQLQLADGKRQKKRTQKDGQVSEAKKDLAIK